MFVGYSFRGNTEQTTSQPYFSASSHAAHSVCSDHTPLDRIRPSLWVSALLWTWTPHALTRLLAQVTLPHPLGVIEPLIFRKTFLDPHPRAQQHFSFSSFIIICNFILCDIFH